MNARVAKNYSVTKNSFHREASTFVYSVQLHQGSVQLHHGRAPAWWRNIQAMLTWAKYLAKCVHNKSMKYDCMRVLKS